MVMEVGGRYMIAWWRARRGERRHARPLPVAEDGGVDAGMNITDRLRYDRVVSELWRRALGVLSTVVPACRPHSVGVVLMGRTEVGIERVRVP